MNETWKTATLSDVSDNGSNYLYSLVCDYERYVKNFGFIPIGLFIQGWTCITYKQFEALNIGDIVYTPQGVAYVVTDEPYESDDEIHLYVECSAMKSDGTYDDTGNNVDVLQSGDIYYTDVTHEDYKRKLIKSESEEPLCPILITKTNPPLS